MRFSNGTWQTPQLALQAAQQPSIVTRYSASNASPRRPARQVSIARQASVRSRAVSTPVSLPEDSISTIATPPGSGPRQLRPSLIEAGAAASLSSERRDLQCSLIGLTVKIGLVLMAAVSLVRLASAYQERMDRQGELHAVLQLEQAKLAKARHRFDQLFGVEGEQRLIREQNQWIAPNRLRVVWKPAPGATPRPASSNP